MSNNADSAQPPLAAAVEPNLRHIEEALCQQITSQLHRAVDDAMNWCDELLKGTATEIVVVVLPQLTDQDGLIVH